MMAAQRQRRFTVDSGGEASDAPAITVGWEYVTPEKAKEYLAKNYFRNRHRVKMWVSRLAIMMREGNFYPTHQGIAFDQEGNLIDGQHRLDAIVQSGCASWLLVVRGVNRDHLISIDRGKARSDADQIRVATDLERVTALDVAVARMMIFGIHVPSQRDQTDLTIFYLKNFVQRYWDAIQFVNCHGLSQGFTAVIRGAIAKAYYHEDQELLNRFIEVFVSAEPESSAEWAALRLRDYCRDKRFVAGGREVRAGLMRRAISAICAFIERRPISRLHEAKEDPFPIPENPAVRRIIRDLPVDPQEQTVVLKRMSTVRMETAQS
jgi:hypothetical protein